MKGFQRAAAGVLLLAAFGSGCAQKPGSGAAGHAFALPFIENDFAQASDEARRSNLPLFVEVWAPW